jgi:hypothetical protein
MPHVVYNRIKSPATYCYGCIGIISKRRSSRLFLSPAAALELVHSVAYSLFLLRIDTE